MNRISSILIVTVILLSTFSIMPLSSSEAQAYPEVKQLTKNEVADCVSVHALSWDGSKVAFTTYYSYERPYDAKIYVMNTTDDPGQEKLMATAPGWNEIVSISADGSKIVFQSNRKDPNDPWYSQEIFVMNTTDDPGDEIQITDDDLLDNSPDISGNGEIIAWHSAPTTWTGFDIVAANISDMINAKITRLPTGPNNDEYASLPYDGKFLSFWSEGNLCIINSNGTGLTCLTEADFRLGVYAISADGSKVAFNRRVGDDSEMFVYDITHDTVTQLTNNDAEDVLGGINGDGTVVTYWRDGDIFIHNMTAETQLTDEDFDDQYPRISGDGSVIVFRSNRDGPDYDLFMIRLQEQISASVDIDPDTLNLKSEGNWITTYIELPEGYDVNDINVSTILLNDTIPVDLDAPAEIGDYDSDGTSDLMVKFDRAEVISYILSNVNSEERSLTVTLSVTGELYDGTLFQGNDTIRILVPHPQGKGKVIDS